MTERYDLVVLGVGMAGLTAANRCAREGWSVAVVDPLPYGGTCALRGCDPKKMLRRGAEVIEAARMMAGLGVREGGLSIDWPALMAHKRAFTDAVPGKIEDGLDGKGIATLHGPARFMGERTLDVEGRAIEAGHVLIATGQRPRDLRVPGAELAMDSAAFLELDELPARILFVGGGYVSMEFAHIAARAGADVTVADRGDRSLKFFDPDLVDALVAHSRALGMRFEMGAALVAIERRGADLVARFEREGERFEIAADLVVHGAGRVPEIDRLDLDAAGIAHGPKGVAVTEHLRSTTNARVFAAGDVADTAGPPLTPVAVHEGKVAASNMIRGDHLAPDYRGVPSAAFTLPEIVRIGMSEDEAREGDRRVRVAVNDTSGWYSNRRVGASLGMTKVIVDEATDEVLGVHLLGHHYTEAANLFGLAMRSGLKARDLRRMISTYPTVGSDVGAMLG